MEIEGITVKVLKDKIANDDLITKSSSVNDSQSNFHAAAAAAAKRQAAINIFAGDCCRRLRLATAAAGGKELEVKEAAKRQLLWLFLALNFIAITKSSNIDQFSLNYVIKAVPSSLVRRQDDKTS